MLGLHGMLISGIPPRPMPGWWRAQIENAYLLESESSPDDRPEYCPDVPGSFFSDETVFESRLVT